MPSSPLPTTVATSITPSIEEQPLVPRLGVPVQGRFTGGRKTWECYEKSAKESGRIPSLCEYYEAPGRPSVMAGTAVFEGHKLHPDTCFTFNRGGGGEPIDHYPADKCYPFTSFTAVRDEFDIGGKVSFTPEDDKDTYAQVPTFEFALAPSHTPEHRTLFMNLFSGRTTQVKGRDGNGHLVDDSVIGDKGSEA
jgi:hypothetical protein